MENIIKNIGLVENQELRQKLEFGALQHRKFSRIEFKILKIENNKLHVQIKQTKSPFENYADKKRLIEICHEFFDANFEAVLVHPIPFNPSPILEVTPEWINAKLKVHNIKQVDLMLDLDISKPELSKIISGQIPMGGRTKGLFYYYFKYLEKTK